MRIIDLHFDLLSYLAASVDHSPYDDNCFSVRELYAGNVTAVVLPVFSPSSLQSENELLKQLSFFQALKKNEDFSSIKLFWAIENCSTFVGEEEDLELGFMRFYDAREHYGSPLYVSFTWNQKNRFGGGIESSQGLTDDGKSLCGVLSERKICVDLSHACDVLIDDILQCNIPVIASHSNFRSITDVPRNIRDEHAAEIVQRGGIIGVNVIKPFVGDTKEHFFAHIEHALNNGWAKHIAIGADFFSVDAVPKAERHRFIKSHFFQFWDRHRILPEIIQEIAKRYGQDIARDIAWNNAISFFDLANVMSS